MSADLDEKVAYIHRLLVEAYDHYFTYESHCKSSEAKVSLHYPNYWDLKDGKTEPSVSVYSYCLGPSREHYFETVDEALAAVKGWHAKEMAFVPDTTSAGEWG